MRRLILLSIAATILAGASRAHAQNRIGDTGPEFPPGVFTDGGKYQLANLKGKTVVLYFFDPNSQGVQQDAKTKNLVVQAFQGKPVMFFGIAVNGTPEQAAAFAQNSGIAMPIFADNLGLMHTRYDQKLMENQYSIRILDGEGRVAGSDFRKDTIDKVVGDGRPETIFKELELKPKFNAVTAPFEIGQFAAGMKQLQLARKNTTNKADVAILNKIQDVAKKEVAKWKKEADEASKTAPIDAYDLYQKVAAALPADDLGKSSQAEMKKIAFEKSMKAELAARIAYQKVVTAMVSAAPSQKAAVAAAFHDVGKKHPDTPTGVKATQLADELGYEAPKAKKK